MRAAARRCSHSVKRAIALIGTASRDLLSLSLRGMAHHVAAASEYQKLTKKNRSVLLQSARLSDAFTVAIAHRRRRFVPLHLCCDAIDAAASRDLPRRTAGGWGLAGGFVFARRQPAPGTLIDKTSFFILQLLHGCGA